MSAMKDGFPGEKNRMSLNWEDVYILPSYSEGLPIAILVEAMSYKHPVISTPALVGF